MKLEVAALTDVGRIRPANEDAFVVADDARSLAVADGMGGHQAGEVASATAIDALRSALDDGNSIEAAIAEANAAVLARAAGNPDWRGMGTTVTAAVYDDNVLTIGHVGDSRAYLMRDGALEQLTMDHSVVAELIAAGHLTESEAETDPRRSMITRALGIEADVEVDVVPLTLQAGDRLLFCSDGLTTMIDDDAIASVLRDEPDRDRAAEALVAAANEAGGIDNITVLVIDAVDNGASALPTAPAPAAPPDPPDDTDEIAAADAPEPPAANGGATEPDATPKRRRWRRRKS